MKKILLSVAMLCMALGGRAETQDVCQGWPADYGGVMLQGFWWDSYDATQWTNLTARADELSQYFDLIWIPNSGTCSGDYNGTQGNSMGYDPCYWLHHNSCFGTEEQLRTMINTYKQKGVGFIADVVVNHKKGKTNWCDFPKETVEGTGQNAGITYNIEWDNSYFSGICKNDECNYYKNESGAYPYKTSGEYDTGDNFDGYRDLDHTNQHVRENIMVYLHYLLNELGYAGFRYDMVKGYGAGYIQTYNNNEYARNQFGTSAVPTYSVGEFWDNQENTQNWINGTGRTSAAFDFALKFKLNDAISRGNYEALQYKSFTYDPYYSRYSVTFADNHDTGRESSKLEHNWSAANAFILASPGTPCIWYPHYEADRDNIRAMILARKACGITNTNCNVQEQYATDNNSGYVLKSVGSKGSVYVLLGQAVYTQNAPEGYTLVAEGDAYKFFSTKADFASMTVSPNVGFFTTKTLDVTLTPVNAQTDMAWYSFNADGTGKTSINNATTITIGENVSVNSDITVYWGAKGADGVEHTGSATFTKRNSYEPSAPNGEECVFFETDANKVSVWAWKEGNPIVSYTGETWDEKLSIDVPMGVNEAGKLIYKWVKPTDIDGSPTKIIFVTDDGQTGDLDYVNHGYYTASGLSYHLGSNTVYYDNSVSQWDKVYYYAWDNQGRCKTQWPGEEVTTIVQIDGRDCYKVELDGQYTSVIFNYPEATDVKQTEDLVVENEKVYQLAANTVYFDNSPTQWENVYYYAYTDDEQQKTKWPGEKIAAPIEANKYAVNLLEKYTKVIFNDGTQSGSTVGVNQTPNLDVENNKVYSMEIADISSIGMHRSFNNNGNETWETVSLTSAGEDYTWTYLLDLSDDANFNPEFKLRVNDNVWMGYDDISKTAPYNWLVAGSNYGGLNIKIMNSYANFRTYLITVTWKPSASVETGWSLKIEGVEPRNDSPYVVAGMSEMLGSFWDASDSNNSMILGDDGQYYYLTKSVYLDKNRNYEFKVVKDGDWDHHAFPSSNYVIYIETAGLYEVSFYFHPSDSRVTHKVVSKNNLDIVDGEPFEVNGAVEGFSVTTASYHRAFKNNWGTLCLPFEIKNSYNGVTFYQLGAVDTENKVLTFTEMTTPVAAGQPVVYKAADGVALDITEVDAKIASDAKSVDDYNTGWTLHGTFTNQTGLNAGQSEYLYYIASNQFWQGVNTNIAAYRAWFTTSYDALSSSAPVAPFRIAVGEEGQDIQMVEQEDGSVKVYYDLQGRRLNQARKGLVIENGKLIFIK